MKRLSIIATILLSIVLLPACHHDEPELGVDFSKKESLGKRFVPYAEHDHDIQEEQPWTRLPEDPVFDADGKLCQAPRRANSLVLTDMARGILESVATYNVHQVCGTYMSTDAYGNDIKLSGAVYYPPKGKIKNVIICSHYTVAADYEVPSATFPLEATMAAMGYVVVMPDYIGYGASRDCVHPYLQAYVTAANVIDMALAVQPFLAERKIVVESDEVILVGYSQGGATSMFVQYCMENQDEYKGLFKIKKNYCGGGPYNVARTYDFSVKLDETGIPYAVPMIILGMSEGMNEPLKMEKFFQEPLLSHYKEWFNTKSYNGQEITRLIGVNRLSKILTPAGLDRSEGETKRLYRELQANSLPQAFRPKAPLYMFHSMDDQTVPFINAQVTRYNFTHYSILEGSEPADNVEYDFDHYGNHQSGCIKFYLKMFKLLK